MLLAITSCWLSFLNHDSGIPAVNGEREDNVHFALAFPQSKADIRLELRLGVRNGDLKDNCWLFAIVTIWWSHGTPSVIALFVLFFVRGDDGSSRI